MYGKSSSSSVVCIPKEIVILWVYYTIPFGFSLFWHFGIFSHSLNYFDRLRITDEGSVPEMRIWSIL